LGERPVRTLKIAQPNIKKKYDNFGLKVKSINRSLAEELRHESRKGVFVVEVEHFSPAHEANIRVSDIILEVDEKKITSKYAFEQIIKKLKPGDVYILKLKRHSNIFHRFLEIPIH